MQLTIYLFGRVRALQSWVVSSTFARSINLIVVVFLSLRIAAQLSRGLVFAPFVRKLPRARQRTSTQLE